MRDLDAFADAAERHGVVAHDVAAAQHRKPMVPGLRTPVSPWRLQVATSGSATSQAEAMVSPIFSAVPEGASTLLR